MDEIKAQDHAEGADRLSSQQVLSLLQSTFLLWTEHLSFSIIIKTLLPERRFLHRDHLTILSFEVLSLLYDGRVSSKL